MIQPVAMIRFSIAPVDAQLLVMVLKLRACKKTVSRGSAPETGAGSLGAGSCFLTDPKGRIAAAEAKGAVGSSTPNNTV